MPSAAIRADERIAVLVVDDDADQAALVARTLHRQESPFEVTTLADGQACLDFLARQSCTIVLLDYSLPRLDGLQVLAEIRKRGITVPVVMVTGQGNEHVAVEAMRAGASDYVIKSRGYLTTLATVIWKVLKQHELALENARLYAEAQRSLVELQAAQDKLIEGATLRALGAMASGAAHHLNNLLAVVVGRAELLLRSTDGATSSGRALEAILRAGKDAAEVVRRVQRFARGDQAGQHQPVDINALARDVVEMTQARWQDEAQARGVRIEVSLRLGGVTPVAGNASELREVFMNLVLNAVDALPEGGQIQIRTFVDAEWTCLAVADTGCGMSDEVRSRALEPFFTTKGPKGTGLGLSVSYGIIKSHGGRFDLDSAPGRGTIATVRLPRAAAIDDHQHDCGRGRAPMSDRCRILIVDDDELVRSVMMELVASQGHEVLEAASGRAALALLEGDAEVDLVLTDLGMPEMTGWDLARAIRSHWPRLTVGMVTGWGAEAEVSGGERGLVAGTLTKPVTAEALGAFLLEVLAAVRSRQPIRA